MPVEQPRFVGSSPADIAMQAAQVGARYAEIMQQSVKMGMDAYQVRKARESAEGIAANQEKSAYDRLKLTLKGQDLSSAIAKDGVQAFVDRGEEIQQYFTDLYGEAGQDIFDATSRNILASISPEQAAKMGMFSFGAEGPNSDQPQAAPAGGLFSLPPTQAPYSKTVPGAQAPAAQAPIAPDTSAPTVASAATPTPVAPAAPDLATVKSILKAHNTAPADTKNIDAATTIEQLRAGFPNSFKKYVDAVAPQSSALGGTAAGSQIASATKSLSKADMNAYQTALDAMPKSASREAANVAITKIMNQALSGSTEKLTPKDQAAVKALGDNFARVAANTSVAKYMRAGGSKEALESAARNYNQLSADMQDFIRNEGQLSSAEAKTYYAGKKADLDAQKALAKAGYDEATITDRRAALAVKSAALVEQLQDSYTRAQAALISATRENNSESIKEARLGLDTTKAVLQAFQTYAAAENNARAGFRTQMNDQGKQWTKEAEDNYIKQAYTEKNGILYTTRNFTSGIISGLLGVPPSDEVFDTAGQYLINIGGFRFGELAAPAQVSAPEIPIPGKKKPVSTTTKSAPGLDFDPSKY
jgi:hypothetical protein